MRCALLVARCSELHCSRAPARWQQRSCMCTHSCPARFPSAFGRLQSTCLLSLHPKAGEHIRRPFQGRCTALAERNMRITALQPVATPSSREVADPAQLDTLCRDGRISRPPLKAAPRAAPSDDVARRGRRCALISLGAATLQLGGHHQAARYPRPPRPWCLPSPARRALINNVKTALGSPLSSAQLVSP